MVSCPFTLVTNKTSQIGGGLSFTTLPKRINMADFDKTLHKYSQEN